MTEKILKNNQAVVAGEIISDFEFSHEVFGEGFYFVKLKVSRLSHSSDIIPLLVSERLIDVSQSHIGQFLEARGQFRSYNKHENNRNHLVLSLFVRELELIDSVENRKPNMIFLDGYICKEPVYRTTPLGREIADVLLAVNRAYVGDVMPDMQEIFQQEAEFSYGEEFRAENIRSAQERIMWLAEQHMKFL